MREAGPATGAPVEPELPPDGARIPDPTHRLAREARTAWRVSGIPFVLLLMLAAGSVSDRVPGLTVLAWVVAVVGAVLAIGVVPDLRWRRWRYEVREHEIDIRHGAITIRRTLVPMLRIQHVNTEQGPLQQTLDLATVSFHTAAGKTEIPHLRAGEASRLRDRIAELARTPDEL